MFVLVRKKKYCSLLCTINSILLPKDVFSDLWWAKLWSCVLLNPIQKTKENYKFNEIYKCRLTKKVV